MWIGRLPTPACLGLTRFAVTRLLWQSIPNRAIGVNVVYNYVTAEVVPRMKDADKPVWRWAVNTERSSLSLARMGVASITVAILIGYLRPLQDGKHQTRGLHARLSEPKSTLPSPF